MSPFYRLHLDQHETYECGAMLLTILAFPNRTEDTERRESLYNSLCAMALRAMYDKDTRGWTQPQAIKPIYAFQDPHQIERDLRALKRALKNRMAAARMAIGLLQKDEPGHIPKLPKGARRLSVQFLADLVIPDTYQSNAENVMKRVWKPSLPVIHIAAAISVIKDAFDKSGADPLSIGHLILNRRVIESVVLEAQRYELLVSRSGIRIRSEDLERIRLA